MKKGRKKKVRYIQKMPEIVQFSPRGKPGRPNEIELRLDQYETIKLADLQGYSQTEGATSMGISRPTFGRILREARKILASALINGMIIHIRTGDVQVGVRQHNLAPKGELISLQKSKEKHFRERILRYEPIKKPTKVNLNPQ